MNLAAVQTANKDTIEAISAIVGIDPDWAVAIALVESSLGLNQMSTTGCRGVFQMSSIAMKDLLLSMDNKDDDMIDILCGIAFLWLLYKRHGSIEAATNKYCDPADRGFYWNRVNGYMEQFKQEGR
jgi:hypothetical protein